MTANLLASQCTELSDDRALNGARDWFSLRAFSRADIPYVVAVLSGLPADYPNADEWLARRLNDCLNGEALCKVAVTRGHIVGLTILTPKSNSVKLSTIFVVESARNAGVGAQLLSQALVDSRHLLGPSCSDELYVTVAKKKWRQVAPLLERHNFVQTAVERNRYGFGRDEVIATHLQPTRF